MLSELRAGRARLAVIDPGYVGYPLTVHFGQHFETVGYDSNMN